MNTITVEYYEGYSKLTLKKKVAKELNVFEQVTILEDTPKSSDFLIVEAYRPETDELIELMIEKEALLKKYQ